jgi:hypothetical protein
MMQSTKSQVSQVASYYQMTLVLLAARMTDVMQPLKKLWLRFHVEPARDHHPNFAFREDYYRRLRLHWLSSITPFPVATISSYMIHRVRGSCWQACPQAMAVGLHDKEMKRLPLRNHWKLDRSQREGQAEVSEPQFE